jgi:hypothetical protein
MRLDYRQNARASDCGDIVGVGDFPRSRLLGVHISLDVVYEFELKGHVMCSKSTGSNPGFV